LKYSTIEAAYGLNIVHPTLLYTNIYLATFRRIWRLILSFKVNDRPWCGFNSVLRLLDDLQEREWSAGGDIDGKFPFDAQSQSHLRGIVTRNKSKEQEFILGQDPLDLYLHRGEGSLGTLLGQLSTS